MFKHHSPTLSSGHDAFKMTLDAIQTQKKKNAKKLAQIKIDFFRKA